MASGDDLLTIQEAAALLRMSIKSFRRRMERGEFDVFRDQRVTLVPRRAIVAYVQRHTVPARVGSGAMAVASAACASSPARDAGCRRRVSKLWDESTLGTA